MQGLRGNNDCGVVLRLTQLSLKEVLNSSVPARFQCNSTAIERGISSARCFVRNSGWLEKFLAAQEDRSA